MMMMINWQRLTQATADWAAIPFVRVWRPPGLAQIKFKATMWTNAQRDGRSAECRWRPLFSAAKFG